MFKHAFVAGASPAIRLSAALACAGLLLAGCGEETVEDLPDQLALPGDTFYPESVFATQDGAIYVGSLGTGQVVRFAPGAAMPTVLLQGGDPRSVTGIAADSAASTLFVCAVDFTQSPPASELRAYDLTSAAWKQTHPFPGFCADLTLDDAGNLFIADSYGKVHRLARGEASTPEVWSSDPLLAPSASPATGAIGADGIAFDATGNIYVNTFTDGRLVRIPILADGTAGAAVQIDVSPALTGPDGMRMIDENRLIVAENRAGQLTEITVSGTEGTARVVESGLDSPTSVAKSGDSYWVAEGQLRYLLGQAEGSPSLPFVIERVPAD